MGSRPSRGRVPVGDLPAPVADPVAVDRIDPGRLARVRRRGLDDMTRARTPSSPTSLSGPMRGAAPGSTAPGGPIRRPIPETLKVLRGQGRPAHPHAPPRRVRGRRRRRRPPGDVRHVPGDARPPAGTGSTAATASGRWAWRATARSIRATSRRWPRTDGWRRGHGVSPRAAGAGEALSSSCPATGTSRTCPTPCSSSICGSSSRASRTGCRRSCPRPRLRPRPGPCPSTPASSTRTSRPASRSTRSASSSPTSRPRSPCWRSAARPAPRSPAPSRQPRTARSSTGRS